MSKSQYEYLTLLKSEIKEEVKSEMIKGIIEVVKTNLYQNIKEHASLIELAQVPSYGNKNDLDSSVIKEEVSDLKVIITRINSKNESIEKRFAEWDKRIPKLETEVITARSDIAMRTTKEEFNIVMQQLPHVATKQDIE